MEANGPKILYSLNPDRITFYQRTTISFPDNFDISNQFT